MSATIKSGPIRWGELPGYVKERLCNDSILVAQDAAELEHNFMKTVIEGLDLKPTHKVKIRALAGYDVSSFRVQYYNAVLKCAEQLTKNRNSTDLSVWFSDAAKLCKTRLNEAGNDCKLSWVRNNLSGELFGIKSGEVRGHFHKYPDPKDLDETVVKDLLYRHGCNDEDVTLLIEQMKGATPVSDNAVIINNLVIRSRAMGFGDLVEYLPREYIALVSAVVISLPSFHGKYRPGSYSAVTLATNLLFGVGYRELRKIALAGYGTDLVVRDVEVIVKYLNAMKVNCVRIDELRIVYGEIK